MTTWAEYREQETARLADDLAAVQAKLNAAIADAPWYGRWPTRALYLACRVWARFRR